MAKCNQLTPLPLKGLNIRTLMLFSIHVKRLPATEAACEGRTTTTPETAADGVYGVAWVVTYTVECVDRTLSQPIRDDGVVTWCQATVGIANDKLLDSGVVKYLFQRQKSDVLQSSRICLHRL